MQKKRTFGQMIWLALRYAIQDRLGIIDAYWGDREEEAVQNALADIRSFRAIQIALFGTDKSKLDVMIAKCRFAELTRQLDREIADDEPEGEKSKSDEREQKKQIRKTCRSPRAAKRGKHGHIH